MRDSCLERLLEEFEDGNFFFKRLRKGKEF